MTTNPGGPGGAGLTLSAVLRDSTSRSCSATSTCSASTRAGSARARALQCLTTAEKLNALPVTPDYKERTKLTHEVEVAEAKLQADACAATEFGQFVSSQQTVYDMEFLRALLKSRQLNFIGYSYGTWLGGWYADTYPSKVGRFVLDSNMDWTRTQWENVNFDPFSGQRRRDTQLFPWIARHADQIEGLGSTSGAGAGEVQRHPREAGLAGRRRVRATSAATTWTACSTAPSTATSGSSVPTLDILVHDEYIEGAVRVR